MERLSKFIALTVPFSVVISACYLWGYWETFNVDIFSYLTVSDIAVFSVVPLFGMGIFSVIGLGIGNAIHEFEQGIQDSEAKKHVTTRKLIRIFDKAFLLLIITAAIFGGPVRWLIPPPLFTIFLNGCSQISSTCSDASRMSKS